MKKRKPYTVSEAARRQRALAPAKKNPIRSWITTKISTVNNDWCRKKFGTVNIALTVLKDVFKKNGGVK